MKRFLKISAIALVVIIVICSIFYFMYMLFPLAVEDVPEKMMEQFSGSYTGRYEVSYETKEGDSLTEISHTGLISLSDLTQFRIEDTRKETKNQSTHSLNSQSISYGFLDTDKVYHYDGITWTSFSDLKELLDLSFWNDLLTPLTVKGSAADQQGVDRYVLTENYDGQTLADMVEKLQLFPYGRVDITDLTGELSIWCDKPSGRPVQFLLEIRPVNETTTVLYPDKTVVFAGFRCAVTLQKDHMSFSLSQDALDSVTKSFTEVYPLKEDVTEKPEQTLVSADAGWSVGFRNYTDYDKISVGESALTIQVSAPDGTPLSGTVEFLHYTDFYTLVTTERQPIATYYENQGLSAISVSNLSQSAVNDKEFYWYVHGYTDASANFTNLTYTGYLNLGKGWCVKASFSALADRGVTFSMSDYDVLDLFSHIWTGQEVTEG